MTVDEIYIAARIGYGWQFHVSPPVMRQADLSRSLNENFYLYARRVAIHILN
jgi:hypothetical protein